LAYAKDVLQEDLAPLLMELSRLYYEQLAYEPEVKVNKPAVEQKTLHPVYQCSHCLTVYDQAFGDEIAGVAAGVTFEELPPTYVCSLCEAPKKDFVKLQLEKAPLLKN
ncbi:MAG: rubredoxin, partial [Bacteroidota bacterium]|nr:rubredoxin [Bacteroidota bacterium]